jgi:tetratricopeptide (TPR) repeat protein
MRARISTLKVQGTYLRLKGDFTSADRVSRELKQAFPEQGIGYTFNLNSLVTKLSWDDHQTRFDEEILDDAEKALSICNRQINSDPDDYRGYYHCGQAHFALTYLHALRGNYYRAGTNGSNTISNLEQVLRINPSLIDARMHLGIAYYYADNLPPFVKAFSRFLWFIPTGNSDKSLPYIKDVTEHGEFFKDVATYLYAGLLTRGSESDRLLGISLLQKLVNSYPENSRFQLRYISQLGQQGLYVQSLEAADDFIATGQLYGRDPVDVDLAWLWTTRAFLELKQAVNAVSAFDKISQQASFPSWGKAWFLLTLAQISDLQEKRKAAIGFYEDVIKLQRDYPSKMLLTLAREGLKEPFSLTKASRGMRFE